MTEHPRISDTAGGRLISLPVVLSLIAISVFAIGIGLWQYLTPPIYDDITYQYACLDTSENDFWALSGDEITTFSEAGQSALNHWKLVNGRLANILMILLVPVPAWLLAALQGIMAGGMAVFIFSFGLGRKVLRASWICALTLLCIWKLLPWFEYFCADDFFINYIWSCTLVLAFLWVVLHPALLSSPLRVVGAVILGLIAGMMHEGISLPVLAALCLLLIFPSIAPPSDSQMIWRRKLVLPVCAFALGTMLCVLAPSTFDRLARKDAIYTPVGFGEMCAFFLHYMVPAYLYLALCVCVWVRCGFRQLMNQLRGQVFWLVIVAGVCALLVLLEMLACRMLLLPNVILIILSLRMLAVAMPGWLRPLKGLASVCIIVQILFFWRLLTLQSALGKDLAECMTAFKDRGDGRVYIDKRIDGNDVPWYTFGMLHDERGASSTFYQQLVKTIPGYKHRHNIVALVLPDSMSGCNGFDDMPEINGDNPFRGQFPMVLSRQYLAPGTEVGAEYGAAYGFNSPWRKSRIRPGEGRLIVKECHTVPAFEPDTVYALFFSDPSGRMQVQSVTGIIY